MTKNPQNSQKIQNILRRVLSKNVIYEGTPHGKAELAYFYFYFLLVLNLIYLAVEYVELYKLEFCVVTAL